MEKEKRAYRVASEVENMNFNKACNEETEPSELCNIGWGQ